MKLCAIIAEFNPFTNGHEYIISSAKQKTGLPVLILMSGSVVQRGEIAIFDKYQRAIYALESGADYCFELPTIYALSSAKEFADGAIRCLSNMPVSHLAFGIETSKAELIEKYANILYNMDKRLEKHLKAGIKKGESYSVSLYNALLKCYDNAEVQEVFSSPNNILAIEYLKAIKKYKANITPVFIERIDNGYSSSKIKEVNIDGHQKQFASASKVREIIYSGKPYSALVPFSPPNVKLNKEAENERLSALLINSISSSDLANLYDYDNSSASVIKENALAYSNTYEIVQHAKSKCHRASRIKRLLFYPYFNLTKELANQINSCPPAVNVLAVKKQLRSQLSEIISASLCKIISSTKPQEMLEGQQKSLLLDQEASKLFAVVKGSKIKKDKTLFI